MPSKLMPWITNWRTVMPVAAILLFAFGLDHHETQSIEDANRERISQSLAHLRADFEKELSSRLFLVHGLSAFAKNRPSMSYPEFQSFVQYLVEQAPGIRSIQWSPGAVVTHVYPVKGNEAAIGHDLRADPTRRESVDHAIRERSFVVSGPVDLRQGGYAIIARNPVHAEGFLGFATILIDMETLYAAVDLPRHERELRIAIRGKDGLGREGAVFYGDERVFSEPGAAFANVTLPHGNWEIAAALRDPDAYHWVGRFPLAVAVLLAIATVLYLNRRAVSAETALRTSEVFLREAQQLAQIGSWEHDIANNAVTWSDETYRIFETAPLTFSPSYAHSWLRFIRKTAAGSTMPT